MIKKPFLPLLMLKIVVLLNIVVEKWYLFQDALLSKKDQHLKNK